jgi:AcrR family transcriptional regulator
MTRSETRDRILAAASSAFAAAGFAGARVDAIARDAGVNKAMLYYHVGDKRALYTEVLLRNFDRVEDALAVVAAGDGSPAARLGRVIGSLTSLLAEHPDHPRIVLREVASGAANLPDEVLARMLGVVDVVRALLVEGVTAGELRSTDPVLTHLTVVGALLFMTSTTPLRERAADLVGDDLLPRADTDLAAFLADLLVNGLSARSSDGARP